MVAYPFVVQMLHQIAQIVDIAPRQAPRAGDQIGLGLVAERSGPLRMAAIGQEGEGAGAAALGENDLGVGLDIGLGRLFALHQIGVDGGPVGGRDAIGRAAHRAARRQAQNQARPRRRAAMMHRINAEGPPAAMEHGALALYIVESRSPHQRAVTEHPKLAGFFHRHPSRVPVASNPA